MKLFEIVKRRHLLQQEMIQKADAYKKERDRNQAEVDEMLRLEDVAQKGLDVEKIQIAKKLLRVAGDPYGVTDGGEKYIIAEAAIIDIANDFKHLRTQYFGNKEYGHFYQRCDCRYGFGPTHGGIVDSIGLVNANHEFTDEEKDACIYYLKNYNAIKNHK